MFASLDRIDAVVEAEAGEKRVFIQTDHRNAAEMDATPELTVLLALGRTLNPRQLDTAAEVRHVVPSPPSDALLQAVTAAGGVVQVDQLGPVPASIMGHPAQLADDAFGALAHRVSAREHLAIDAQGLRALAERFSVLELSPDADALAYWSAVLELSAFTAEVLRGELGGTWIDTDEHLSSALPFCFAFSPDGHGESRVNVVNKVVKYLAEGDREHPLLLLMMARDQALPQGGAIMFSFKPHDWAMRDRMPCRPLLEQQPDADLPLLVYGRDLPSSFQYGDTDDLPLDELHELALEHLAKQQVHISTTLLGDVTFWIVEGSYFAAEKLLDIAFMRDLQAQVGAQTLGVVPILKGTLLVRAADDAEQILLLVNAALALGEPQGADVLSTTPILVRDGQIIGCVHVNDEDPEAADEPPLPAPSWWRRWLGQA